MLTFPSGLSRALGRLAVVMLGIQLASLSAPELRRLLDAARDRGQEGLVRQLEAELAGRSGRMIAQPRPMSAAPPEAPQPSARRAPRAAPEPAVRRRRAPAVAVVGLAGFTGAALAWGVSLQNAPPPRPQPVTLAAATPAPRIAVALTTAALPEEALAQPVEEPAAPAPDAPLNAAAPPARAAERNPCYDLPTARERLICGYPSLAIQDRRLKAALDRARAASRDPSALDDGQAAWQSASANISDRLALADRYAQRIAELEEDAR